MDRRAGSDYSAAVITSRISSKAQTTLPLAVRKALDVREGDQLAYAIKGGVVVISKAAALQEDPFALFDEWSSEQDAKAYAAF